MKIIDVGEKKAVNALLYFIPKVKYPYKTKLFKLLYFLDFMHFREVGRPVTNFEYFTLKKGPVPLKLHNAIKDNKLSNEFRDNIAILEETTDSGIRITNFIPKNKCDLTIFSEREKRLLEKVAIIFRDAKADMMIEVTHLKNTPWEKTLKEKGLYKKIDFYLALDDKAKIDEDTAKERIHLREEMFKLFS